MVNVCAYVQVKETYYKSEIMLVNEIKFVAHRNKIFLFLNSTSKYVYLACKRKLTVVCESMSKVINNLLV